MKSYTITPDGGNCAELRNLWLLFGDIPIDNEDKILEPFGEFDAGTDRFEVWHWFDDRYPGGVTKLMDDVM